MLRVRLVWWCCAVAVVGGCGGSSSSENSEPPPPDLVVFFVSGHQNANGEEIPDGRPSESYLQNTGGPKLVEGLEDAGYTVFPLYYVDDAFEVQGFPGYVGLVQDMQVVRNEFVPRGSRVVVVAHSHGGVWAHSAISDVPGLTVNALVDLDTSSYGWGTVGHDFQNGYIGGDPRDRYLVESLTTCPGTNGVPSEQTFNYDVEDVVPQNVVAAFEIRSGDSPFGGEQFDEKWNVRIDTAVDGLACYFSGTDHSEVHDSEGATLSIVSDWLVSVLEEG